MATIYSIFPFLMTLSVAWKGQVSYGRKLTNQILIIKDRKAQQLFSSKKEAITFAEDYGLDEAHVDLLHTSGMIMELAEVLMKSGKVVEAVKTLIATPEDPGHKRHAVDYLLTGFWQYQTFGMDHITMDPGVVSELLALADTLRNDMHQQEAREVCSFFSYTISLTIEKYSLQCSKQGTKLISKYFVLCTQSSSKKGITPLLYCALIRSSSPLSLHKALPRSIPGPSFPSTLPTSSFWIS